MTTRVARVFPSMNKQIDQVKAEIDDLRKRQNFLDSNHNRTPVEEAELLQLSQKLAALETRYNTLVNALATADSQTQSNSTIGHEMEVDSNSTTSDSSRLMHKGDTQTDGIDIHAEHLKRQDALEKLASFASQYQFVRLTSPAASGKTSLLKMYQHTLKKTKIIWISCSDERSGYELLKAKGIDLRNQKCIGDIKKQRTVVFLDDAQEKFNEVAFWDQFIKGSAYWMPRTIRFVISSTHLFSSRYVYFSSFIGLNRKDFLLTEMESDEFLESPFIGLPQKMKSETLKQVLIRECGGLIGALRQSIDSLKARFDTVVQPSEADLLQHVLSKDLLPNMERCFGSVHSSPIEDDFKMYLNRILVDEHIFMNGLKNQQDHDTYSSLVNAGILVEPTIPTVGFSSPLAKRYYFKWIYPSRSTTAPSSLSELIRHGISNMSYTALKNSASPGHFPKEAVIKRLFMGGLALHTPSDCSVCTLSKTFPSTQQTSAGDIDFYLSHEDFRWGIQLLVNEDGIDEHISRFTPDGKYGLLAVNDYAVVDFRRNAIGRPTEISKHTNRVSVFFKNDDFSVVQCLFGEDSTVIEITLAD